MKRVSCCPLFKRLLRLGKANIELRRGEEGGVGETVGEIGVAFGTLLGVAEREIGDSDNGAAVGSEGSFAVVSLSMDEPVTGMGMSGPDDDDYRRTLCRD